MERLTLTRAEQFWYVVANIVTLGLPYLAKVVHKKAQIEVTNEHAEIAYVSFLRDVAAAPLPEMAEPDQDRVYPPSGDW
jgi:hypothetical protein